MDIPALWHAFIDWIGDGTGMADSLLHIHAGMAVLMTTRLVTGRSLGSFVPLSVVALAEGANEVLDRLHFGSWRWDDTLSDVANTMFWPTVICLALRIRPLIRVRRHGERRRGERRRSGAGSSRAYPDRSSATPASRSNR